jgi:hypothetical protein
MTVTKTDISTDKPSTINLIQVASGEKVLAEVENQNNLLNLNAIILAFNWIIDSGVELSAANTFTGDQTFNIIKTAYLESLTGSSDVVLQNGTFKYGGTDSDREVATKLSVAAQIAAAGTISLNYAKAAIQTTGFTAVTGNVYPINTTSSAFTATLPLAPSNGDLVGFVDIKGQFSTNNLTIGRNSESIMDLAEDMTVGSDYATVYLTYDSTAGSWYIL